MGYEDILFYIENIIEAIDFDEIDLPEIKQKLQELTVKIEDNMGVDHEGVDGGDFD